MCAAMSRPTINSTYDDALRHHQAGRFAEAETLYRQILSQEPKHWGAMHHLGAIARQRGQNETAVDLIRRAIALKPDYAEAYNNLGVTLQALGQLDEAIVAWRRAVQLKASLADAFNNLGLALEKKGEVDEAVESHQHAIRLRPDYAEAHNNLGNAFHRQGKLDEAIAAYRRAVELKPRFAEAHGNLILTLQYHPGYDARMIREELHRWNERHAEPLKKFIQPHTNDRGPERRLRIGYVSPDFCRNVVGLNLLPLLSQHDHGKMEIFCYSNVRRPDELTAKFQQWADAWHNIVPLSDSKAVDLIRQDRIDILVDLAVHTAGNRLGIFARKPAPIQVTFAGYPGSTGLTAIDYRLSDPHLDPGGLNDSFYSETTCRLPDSFWCYEPHKPEVPVNELPALSNGFLTFGSLNNLCKINEQVLHLWGRVLTALPASRLLLRAPEGSSRQRLYSGLATHGVDPQRVEIVGKQTAAKYLQTYNRIDVGLDPFPYNGHTTSLDALWMGVPILTLVGQTVVGRAGLSQLTNLGLTDFIASTPEQFVRMAVELANDLPRLAALRRTLRSRMQASPLMDAPRFAFNIETAYREMWHSWCVRQMT
jgi:protein O-GlcNAc transferase